MASNSQQYPANTRPSRAQSGNVLFLIMVAVVLFVALAYAVMHMYQSRQNKVRDISLKNNAVVMQYASAMRTGVTRMLLRDIPLKSLNFIVPEKSSDMPPEGALMVFSPVGGGVTFSPVTDAFVTQVENDPSTFTSFRNGNWHFVQVKVGDIGTQRKDLVALLYNVRKQVCEDINYQITGSAVVPVLNADAAAVLEGKFSISSPVINGHPFLCIQTNDGNIYYHVLAEQ